MLNNEKGITLVEILVSFTLLSIILVSIFSFFPQVGKSNKQNEEKIQAINLGKKVLAGWTDDAGNEVSPFIKDPVSAAAPYGYQKKESDDSYFYFSKELEGFMVEVKLAKETGEDRPYPVTIQIGKAGRIITETYGYITVREAEE
ncbi:PulJ/GspJ family protein [Lysinibacillus sphaericus]